MAELRAELKGEMQFLRKENNKYFRWIVGLMFGSFGGIGNYDFKISDAHALIKF